ncbi:MAG TPA: glycosyltransferase family A protein [Parafilimonas sp.]|nr:glycosyltransferase family A protein [Parafilimonas sp.]
MKVSVVIPTYKRPELLMKCLKKLCEQSFSKHLYEVIVVTDGADIETESIVHLMMQQCDEFNLYCCGLDEKKGPAAARNKGAYLAKGELILFTDDDCLPHNNWIENFWKAFITYKRQLIAFTGRTVVPHATNPTDYEKNIAHLETAEFITANCACTKTTFNFIKGFDEDFPSAWREDSEFQFRLINHSIPIIKVDTAIIEHPVRTATWGISIQEQKKSMFNALLYKKHPTLYKEKISQHPVWMYYAMIALFAMFVISTFLFKPFLSLTSFLLWMMSVLIFTKKRLRGASKKLSHVAEMFATSLVIPFLSVYWTLYGSIKYKTLLL